MTAMDLVRDAMVGNRQFLLALLADMDGRALVFRPAGGRGNHALWILGHVATSESHLVEWGGGKKITVPPVADPTKFGMGSTPLADASAYPGKGQLLDYAAAVREQVLARLAQVKAADLARPAVKAPAFFKTRGVVWQTAVTHEMMHIGQLTVIRKELGLPPVIG